MVYARTELIAPRDLLYLADCISKSQPWGEALLLLATSAAADRTGDAPPLHEGPNSAALDAPDARGTPRVGCIGARRRAPRPRQRHEWLRSCQLVRDPPDFTLESGS